MKLFERAAVRARLPLRWGQGFNPHPRLSLPLPRPVGVASEDELLVLELDEPESRAGSGPVAEADIDPTALLGQLAPQMPAEGVELLDVRTVPIVPQPMRARYSLTLDAPPADLDARIESLRVRATCLVARAADAQRPDRQVDIRPYIEQLGWDASSARLTWTLAVTPGGSARPGEVLAALGLEVETLAHRIIREHVDWQFEKPVSAATPAATGAADRKDDRV